MNSQISYLLKKLKDYLANELPRSKLRGIDCRISKAYEASLGELNPERLKLTTTALFVAITFDKENSISPESSAELDVIKKMPAEQAGYRYLVEQSRRNQQKQVYVLQQHLIKKLQVPEQAVVVQNKRNNRNQNELTLRVLRRQ
jgi:hypothetical protein